MIFHVNYFFHRFKIYSIIAYLYFCSSFLSAFLTNWWKRSFCLDKVVFIQTYLISRKFLRIFCESLAIFSRLIISFLCIFFVLWFYFFNHQLLLARVIYLLKNTKFESTNIYFIIMPDSLSSFKTCIQWSISTCFLTSLRIWFTFIP